MTQPLHPSQFDLLDLLDRLGAPVTIDELAARTNRHRETVKRQLNRAQHAGIITRHRPDTQAHATFDASPHGRTLFREALERMDATTIDVPVFCVPRVADELQRAIEATTLLHLTEPKL